MSYSVSGLNAALAGVTGLGTHLALHLDDPGTTGAGEDATVPRLPAAWAAPAAAAAESAEVPFAVPAGGGQRQYGWFGVWTSGDGTGAYVTGGVLDEPETFSDNGGTYNFTASLIAASAA